MEERRSGIGFHDYEDDDGPDDTWAEASAAADERREKAMEKWVEAAHDVAVKACNARVASKRSMNAAAKPPETATSSCKYQFVGVVNDGRGVKKTDPGDVTWYTRKKPRNAKWRVRLVHVNCDAVLRELFVMGNVDVYGKYINNGLASDRSAAFAAAETAGEDDAAEEEHAGVKPSVRAKYFLKERSLWKNLNNFSPRRMFSTPSGSFWRERRITPGIYTDGTTVYESVYRYRDGMNGMKPDEARGEDEHVPGESAGAGAGGGGEDGQCGAAEERGSAGRGGGEVRGTTSQRAAAETREGRQRVVIVGLSLSSYLLLCGSRVARLNKREFVSPP